MGAGYVASSGIYDVLDTSLNNEHLTIHLINVHSDPMKLFETHVLIIQET